MNMTGIVDFRIGARELFGHFGLPFFRKMLDSDGLLDAAKQCGCRSQRKCPLNAEVVVWLMIHVAFQTCSMTQGLISAWNMLLPFLPTSPNDLPPTESAFCKARDRLNLKFWKELWIYLRSKFFRSCPSSLLWKGLRVWAIDGSDLLLPLAKRVGRWFGYPSNKKGDSSAPQAKLVAVCSIFTSFCHSFVLLPKRFTEHQAFAHLIRQFGNADLILADIGFFSYNAMWRCSVQGSQYLIRMRAGDAARAQKKRRLGADDWIVEFRPGKKAHSKYPGLPQVSEARLLRYQIKGYRPSWLVTSLTDSIKYPYRELVGLYHRRWQIETLYREWKHTLNVQNLRSRTPVRLVKELHAHLILNNLIRWAMTQAAEGTGKPCIAYSFIHAFTHLRMATTALVVSTRGEIQALTPYILNAIRRKLIKHRPNRSYPRLHDKPKNKGNGEIRMPARLTPPSKTGKADYSLVSASNETPAVSATCKQKRSA